MRIDDFFCDFSAKEERREKKKQTARWHYSSLAAPRGKSLDATPRRKMSSLVSPLLVLCAHTLSEAALLLCHRRPRSHKRAATPTVRALVRAATILTHHLLPWVFALVFFPRFSTAMTNIKTVYLAVPCPLHDKKRLRHRVR